MPADNRAVPDTSLPMRAPNAENGAASRRHNEGHGRRLTAAFDALEAFPALAESRNRVLGLLGEDGASASAMVAAVETDVALAISVLRLANTVDGSRRAPIDNVVKAVEVLSPESVQALVSRTRTFDFFERTGLWDATPERFRLHAVSTQHAAQKLAAERNYEHRNRLMITALLHDVGKLRIPLEVLNKPGKLEGEEWTIMKSHAEVGALHLCGIEGSYPLAILVAYEHHMRYDGKPNYPVTTVPRKPTLASQMTAISDVFDAICTMRPYHKARARAVALGIIRERVGTFHHPALVANFARMIGADEPAAPPETP